MSELPVVLDMSYRGRSLFDLAAQSDTPICPYYDTIMKELAVIRRYPVAFVIDEHNEIFKADKQNDVHFRQFTIMTGFLQGVRTYQIS